MIASTGGRCSRPTETRRGVPVLYGHARRLRADDDRVGIDAAVRQTTEDLLGLRLDLLFLAAANVRE